MPQTIEVPGYGDVEFPDGMSDDQISAAIQQNMKPQSPATASAPPAAPTQPNTWGQAFKNVGEGGLKLGTSFVGGIAGNAAGLASIPVDMIGQSMDGATLHLRGPNGGVKKYQHTPIDPGAVRDRVGSALTYQPSNQESLSNKVVDFIPEKVGAARDWLTEQGDKTGLPYVGGLMGAVPEAALNIFGLKAGKGALKPKAAAPEAVPTTAQLSRASAAAYKAADDAGVVIAPQSTARVVGMFKEVADAENLGKLPPKLKEASDVLRERSEAKQPLTLKDADKVRQLINDAKASTDAADRRLAKIVQTKYDKYINELTPEDTLAGDAPTAVASLKDARELYKRQKNSELVDNIEKHAANTGETNYTQAGNEAALRREFLRIVNNEKKARMFTPEQQAAMRTVAAPGAWANTLRNVGKTDPMKGGIPAVSATILGGGLGSAFGPAGAVGGGLLGPALLGGISHLANRGTQAITRSNVLKAREALVGRGLPTTKTAASAASKGAILSELRRLDVDLAALSKSEPFDSPKRRALQQRADLLRAQLVIGESNAASQR